MKKIIFTHHVKAIALSVMLFISPTMMQAQKVVGYLASWNNFPNIIYNIDLTKLTNINIAFANPDYSGVLGGIDPGSIATVVNAAHAKNVKVAMSIGGANASGAVYNALLNNTNSMNNFVNNLVQYAVNNNLDGIDVDIEGNILDGNSVNSTQYQNFIASLGSALHARNKIMTAALGTWFANQVTNYAAAQFDWISVMSYDAYGTWTGPGPHSPYSLAVNDFNYWHSTKGVPASKLMVGMPFYGYSWGSYGTNSLTFSTIVNTYPGAENSDQIGSSPNMISYNGIPTIKQKTTFAIQNAGGVMIWELSQDATGSKSLLLAIDQVIHSSSNIVGVTNLGGAYFLQNRYSGLSMDVQAWSTADGGNIEQWSYSGGTNQQFNFSHLGNGVYEITAVNGGKALDVAGASTADGANVQQWGYGGGSNQQFIVTSTGDGYYKLISKNSNKIVEVAGFSTVPGGNVQQWSDVGQQTGQWKLTPVVSGFSTTIQAENYNNMAGVQTESTTDAGGGLDVGWIDAGDWMEYNSINFPTSGTYTVQYRVASPNGGKLSMDLNAGSIQLGAANIPATGGWQNWTTITQTITVNAGTYNLGIYAQTGGWNINWFTITKQGSARMAQTSSLTNADEAAFELHPNPVFNELFLNIPAGFIDGSVKIINIQGIEMFNSNTVSDKVDVSNLGAGLYSIVLMKDDKMISKRFIKQ
ncbi:MAG TPA: glycosyl hydrolase family 18 protein [Cytophagaceae bacterium]|nr:glycosyl hydrolase family 18 protein [Cytophagaceae bacterium]